MKKTKTLVFLVLIAVLAMLLIPSVFAADVTTVYLDPANGNDTATGLTEAEAVKTVAVAYGLLKEAQEGKIVLLSDLNLSGEAGFGRDTNKTKLTIPVTLTSKTGAERISGDGALRFYCPTILENVTIALTKASATVSQAIYAEGSKLVIGENVTTVATNGYYYSLSGGSRWSTVQSTDLTVKSGTWRNCFANAYGSTTNGVNADVKKDCKVTITGGTFTGAFYPMYQSNTISGNVELSVSNATLNGGVYCSPAVSGTVAGNVTVTIGPNTDVAPIYAGSTKAGNANGTVTIILDGTEQDITNLSGKGLSAATGTVGKSRLVLKSGTLHTAPKNFDEIDIRVAAGKTLTLNGCVVNADSVSSEGTLAFAGRLAYERRVVSGVVACQSLLTTVYEDAANVKAIIEAEQAQLIAKGAKFTPDNIVPLAIEKTEHPEFSYELISINTATGEGTPTNVVPTIYDKVTAYRVAPTAYVIPAGESWSQEMLRLMGAHDIQHELLPAGSKVMLRQYTGTADNASLSNEKEVTFPNGAYVFCMNQLQAKNISKFLEPGMPDISGPYQNKVIPVSGGVIPVYRYEHDLNSQGMIDYIAPNAGLTGDVDGNGTVNADDAVYLLLNTMFTDSLYPIEPGVNTDFDGNGTVNADDAVYLLLYTMFGKDLYPLPQ